MKMLDFEPQPEHANGMMVQVTDIGTYEVHYDKYGSFSWAHQVKKPCKKEGNGV